MQESKILNINAGDFEKEVLKNELPVLVDFWAFWCGPCQMMEPILDELSQVMNGKIKVVKVDTVNPDNQNLAIEYQIQNIPSMKLFKNGKVIGGGVGLIDLETLKRGIEELIK